MNRALGEGRIIRINRKFATISDERLGNVHFPIEAATVTYHCVDLTQGFELGQIVLFTAMKSQPEGNGGRYTASSVVKKRDLISCTGKIVEKYEKFCYAEVRKYGRVFVPYSSKCDPNSDCPWLGRGAETGRQVSLKIFRQPDINNCRFVAFSIGILNDDDGRLKMNGISNGHPSLAMLNSGPASNGGIRLPPSNGQLRAANDRTPESAENQTGVIVICPSDVRLDCLLYSAQTGLARLPGSYRERWMELGRFARYDVSKDDNPRSDAKPVVNWVAKNLKDLGFIYKVLPDHMDDTKLHLDIPAVVNRVSHSTRSSWLWNDCIGRIYVPSQQFNRNLKPMHSVRVRALYTGAFEDVPWSAIHVEIIGEDDDHRNANAQLLMTDDNWVVNYIQIQGPTFYGFMNHEQLGSAFIAWTDLTEADQPPPSHTKCRATVYFQQRDKKHQWRAVLVTPLDENNKPVSYHPYFEHTGKFTLPEAFVPPQPTAPSMTVATAPPPGLALATNNPLPPISQHMPPPNVGVIGSGVVNSSSSTSSSNHTNGFHSPKQNGFNGSSHILPALPPSPPNSSGSPAPSRLLSTDSSSTTTGCDFPSTDHTGDLDLSSIAHPWGTNLFGKCNGGSELWGGDIKDFNLWGTPMVQVSSMAPLNGSLRNEPNSLIPPATFNSTFNSVFNEMSLGSATTPIGTTTTAVNLIGSTTGKTDVSCQTDEMLEANVLRDIMKSKEICAILLRDYSHHFESVMNTLTNKK